MTCINAGACSSEAGSVITIHPGSLAIVDLPAPAPAAALCIAGCCAAMPRVAHPSPSLVGHTRPGPATEADVDDCSSHREKMRPVKIHTTKDQSCTHMALISACRQYVADQHVGLLKQRHQPSRSGVMSNMGPSAAQRHSSTMISIMPQVHRLPCLALPRLQGPAGCCCRFT